MKEKCMKEMDAYTVKASTFNVELGNEFDVFVREYIVYDGSYYACVDYTAVVDGFEILFLTYVVGDNSREDFVDAIKKADEEISFFLNYEDDSCYDYAM